MKVIIIHKICSIENKIILFFCNPKMFKEHFDTYRYRYFSPNGVPFKYLCYDALRVSKYGTTSKESTRIIDMTKRITELNYLTLDLYCKL